jgi:hypothetical protein
MKSYRMQLLCMGARKKPPCGGFADFSLHTVKLGHYRARIARPGEILLTAIFGDVVGDEESAGLLAAL